MYHVDHTTDLDDIQINLSPEGRLWLRVMVDSYLMIRDGWGCKEYAELFLFEPGNIFFESLSEELGTEPEIFRQRIKKALERSKTAARSNAAQTISEKEGNDKD